MDKNSLNRRSIIVDGENGVGSSEDLKRMLFIKQTAYIGIPKAMTS